MVTGRHCHYVTFCFTSPRLGCVSLPLECNFYESRSFACSWLCAQSPEHRPGSWSTFVKGRMEEEPTALQTCAQDTLGSGACPFSESLCGHPNAEPKPLSPCRSLAPGCPLTSALLLPETVPQLMVLRPPGFVVPPELGAPRWQGNIPNPEVPCMLCRTQSQTVPPLPPAPRCRS